MTETTTQSKVLAGIRNDNVTGRGHINITADDPAVLAVSAEHTVMLIEVVWPDGWTRGPSQAGEMMIWDARGRAARLILTHDRKIVIAVRADGHEQMCAMWVISIRERD